jgi:hypothetical protein
MTAIRVRRTLDSDTLHLPELQPLIGKAVEIIVLAESPAEAAPSGKDWSALEAIAGKDLIDPELIERYRAFDRERNLPPEIGSSSIPTS